MTKLYIFGAGASRNYDQGKRRDIGLKMPLDNDFFPMARIALSSTKGHYSGDPWDDSMEHLMADISWLYHGKREFGKDDLSILDGIPSLEEVMSLFHQQNLLLPDSESFPEFGTAKRNRLRTLNALILFTLSRAQDGPLCRKHLKVAEQMNPGDIILSYNYDTILDSALREKHLLTDDGYEMDFNRVFFDGKWGRPDLESSKISMFKLHGSYNWLQCTNCGYKFLNKSNLTFDYLSQAEHYTFEICTRCRTHALVAVLVPPLVGKVYKEQP